MYYCVHMMLCAHCIYDVAYAVPGIDGVMYMLDMRCCVLYGVVSTLDMNCYVHTVLHTC